MSHTIAHNFEKYLSRPMAGYEKAEPSFYINKHSSLKLLGNFEKRHIVI